MILLVFRNDDLVHEYLTYEGGFFWRVVEIEKDVMTKKFVQAHELRKYFPWVNVNTIESFMKTLGVTDYKNNRIYNVYLYEKNQSLTGMPTASIVAPDIMKVITQLREMKVVQEHIKNKHSCKIWDTLADGYYWSWDGDRLDRISEN